MCSISAKNNIRVCADKSLARPVRKQATATKLGIYSKYSPLSSIHFLVRYYNFWKPLKKQFRRLSFQPGLRGSNDLRVLRKMATFQLFFQCREQVVVWRDQIRRIGWVIKTFEAQVGQFLLGCKCPVSRGIVLQEQEPLGYYSEDFLQIVHQLHQQKLVIVRVDCLVQRSRLNPKNSRRKIFQRVFELGIFWGVPGRYGVIPFAVTPLIVALSRGHSDITRFRPWSPIATGNHLDRAQPKTLYQLLR